MTDAFTCYLAAPGYLNQLLDELGESVEIHGDLVVAQGKPKHVFWARNVWLEPRMLLFESIKDAARQLRDIQRNWAPYSDRLHRRTALIAAELPSISRKPKSFPFEVPKAPMGGFCLMDEHTMLASPRCSSPFPNGALEFDENHTDPPSRAYLKLWEALTLLGKYPNKDDTCVDAGASPGGWSWALSELGAKVIAVDRASIDPRVSARPNVRFLKHSAFTLKPEDFGKADWVFSDVICYPRALLQWIEQWISAGLCGNFVCTVKMQGAPDRETIQKFAALPGSRLVHLWHNKHELTWMKITESKV